MRFRLRYSLRMLLVLIMVVALWLGYSANWIRQRRAFLKQPDVRVGTFAIDPSRTPQSAPWLISILGEPKIDHISASEDRREEVERLFPEAVFEVYIEGRY